MKRRNENTYMFEHEPATPESAPSADQNRTVRSLAHAAEMASTFEGDDDETEEQLTGVLLSTDTVKDYFMRIGRHKLLNAEEEVELAKAIEVGVFARDRLNQRADTLSDEESRELLQLAQEGQRARETMVNANLRLVVSIAKRYNGRGMPLLDLIQEGNIGLDRAVQRFDHQKGFKFSTYATWWIRQSINRSMADQQRPIRLPMRAHEELARLDITSSRLESTLGNIPSDDELAAEMDITVDKLQTIRSYRQIVSSLSTPIGSDGDTELGEILADPLARDIAEPLTKAMLRSDMHDVLSSVLSDLELRVIELRFGLDDGEEHSNDYIAGQIDRARPTVRIIQQRALDKLRVHPRVIARLWDYLQAG